MTTHVRVLSVATSHSTPSVAVVSDMCRLLFDCGEGTQRLCVEHKIRLSKVCGIFTTSLDSGSICGLPGMTLTAYDAGRTKLDLIGPVGLSLFWNSNSHFMRLAEQYITIAEASAILRHSYVDIEVLTIPTSNPKHVCYVVQTPTLAGKFDLKKALALKIPKGPLYSKLKNGEMVTLPDGTQVVPEQVLGPSQRGRNIAIIAAVRDSSEVRSCFEWGSMDFDCVVHFSPSDVAASESYRQWLQVFSANCSHIFVGTGECTPKTSFIAATNLTNKLHDALPTLFPLLRATDHSFGKDNCSSNSCDSFSSFKSAGCSDAIGEANKADVVIEQLSSQDGSIPIRIYVGYPLLKFNLLPTNISGIESETPVTDDVPADAHELSADAFELLERTKREIASIRSLVEEGTPGDSCTCDEERKEIRDRYELHDERAEAFKQFGDSTICVLGTGCAVPSKYRNVSSVMIRIASTNRAILLDCGEGTWYQMVRLLLNSPTRQHEESQQMHEAKLSPRNASVLELEISLAKMLSLIWISHPHADHHLGLMTVLSRRFELLKDCEKVSPIVVIAPPAVLCYIMDNARLHNDIFFQSSFVLISNRQIDPNDDCMRGDMYWSNRYLGYDSSAQNDFNQIDIDAIDTDSLTCVSVCPASAASSSSGAQTWREMSLAAYETAKQVLDAVGIVKIENVKVIHCFQAYGVVLSLSNGKSSNSKTFRIVYSGDTRPCDRLAQIGQNASLLIHEATFEDDKGEEAITKRHSTLSEALAVGKSMNAFRVMLTHFSQRYPGAPELPKAVEGTRSCLGATTIDSSTSVTGEILHFDIQKDSKSAIICFDFMLMSFRDLLWVPSTPSLLSQLFPAQKKGKDDTDEEEELIGQSLPATVCTNKKCICGGTNVTCVASRRKRENSRHTSNEVTKAEPAEAESPTDTRLQVKRSKS